MAKRTSDNNQSHRDATGEHRVIGMEANAREGYSGDRAFHQNVGVTHANAGAQMLDLDAENAQSETEGAGESFVLAQAAPAQGVVAGANAGVGKAIGVIQVVIGDVKIMGIDGVLRVAAVGDKVYFKDTVLTGADGVIQIRLDNGQLIDLGRSTKLALDADFFGYDAGAGLAATPGTTPSGVAPTETSATPDKPAAPGSDVAALQAAIARGADPSQAAPATAAGGAPAAGGAGGDGSGGTAVIIDQADSSGTVTAGFGTEGAGITFPEPEFQLQAVEGSPSITINKVFLNVSDGKADNAGDVLNYTVTVTNTGDVALTNVVVTDPLTGLSQTISSLAVGQSVTFETSYTLTQADLDGAGNAGSDHTVGNTATVDSDDTDPVTDSEDVALDYSPAITVDKVFLNVNGNSEEQADSAGDEINYEITVQNTGNVTLTGVTVTDPLTGQSISDVTLAPGESQTFDATYILTQADLDSQGGGDSAIENTATVDSNETLPETDSAETPLVYDPALNIVKDVASVTGGNEEGQADSAGDVINYTITVENTGNVSLTGVTVSDPNADAAPELVGGDADEDGVLDVGETWTYAAQHTVTQDELNEQGGGDGDIDNTATASTEEGASGEESEEVGLAYEPALTILKSLTNAGDAVVDTAGETIEYTITVENTGNVDLTNVDLGDVFAGGATYFSGDTSNIGVLDTDETWTYTADYVVTQDDLNAGDTLTNVATVDTDQTDEQQDDASSEVQQTASIEVTKTADVESVDAAGDVINYTITVDNTGNVALDDTSVTDQVESYSATNAVYVSGDADNDGLLDASETWTYSASYTVTQADIDNNGGGDGEIDNLASATFTDPNGTAVIDSATETVQIIEVPSLADKLFINEVGLDGTAVGASAGGPAGVTSPAGTTNVSYIELLNNFNNAVNSSELLQVKIEIVGPDGTIITIDCASMVQNDGSELNGSAISGNGTIVFYEDGTWQEFQNDGNPGSWGYYNTDGSSTPVSSVDADNDWDLGANTTDEIAINLVQLNSSIDLFVANDVSDATIEALTGIVELDTQGDHDTTFAPIPSGPAGTAYLAALATFRAQSAWEGHENTTDLSTPEGSTQFIQSAIGEAFLDNTQFNGNIADQGYVLTSILADPDGLLGVLDEPTNTYVFARSYDAYINVSGGGGSARDKFPIDTNQEDDWTITNVPTEGDKNNLLPASPDQNPLDPADNMDPNQGSTGVKGEAARVGTDGQQVIDISEGGLYDAPGAPNVEGDDNIQSGGRGPDFMYGDEHSNQFSGGAGNDFLFGAGGNDILNGGSGADLLIDVQGADTLIGGTGADILVTDATLLKNYDSSSMADFSDGGAGVDTFVYQSTDDSTLLLSDIIIGFGDDDKIDLSAIDANTNTGGNGTFGFGGDDTATIANSVTWDTDGTNTYVHLDVNGDTTADMQIILNGVLSLDQSNFVL